MVLNYQISPYPSLMEDLIIRVWESDNDMPASPVYEQTIPEDGGGGHPNIATVIVSGLDLRPHKLRMYAASSGNLLHYYEFLPKVDVVRVFAPLRFKIGDGEPNTPAANSDFYQNDLLIGLEEGDYIIIRNNIGALLPGLNYSVDSVLGVWQFLGGDVFNDTEEFTIMLQPKAVSQLVNDSVVGKWFGGFVDVSATTDYTAVHLRKLIRFAGTNTYRFTASEPPPIGYAFVFTHFGSGVANSKGTIEFQNAPLKWNGTTKASIDIPLYTEGAFVFDGTQWNVIYLSSTIWQNETAALPGMTLGLGTVFVGNVGPGSFPVVTHNLNITGDYMVMTSIQTAPSNLGQDNEVLHCWAHHASDKPNKFLLGLARNQSGKGVNVTLNWIIFKK